MYRSFLSKDWISDLTVLLKGFVESAKDRNPERSQGKIFSLGARRGRDGFPSPETDSARCPAARCRRP